jgi:hypothetical protein
VISITAKADMQDDALWLSNSKIYCKQDALLFIDVDGKEHSLPKEEFFIYIQQVQYIEGYGYLSNLSIHGGIFNNFSYEAFSKWNKEPGLYKYGNSFNGTFKENRNSVNGTFYFSKHDGVFTYNHVTTGLPGLKRSPFHKQPLSIGEDKTLLFMHIEKGTCSRIVKLDS